MTDARTDDEITLRVGQLALDHFGMADRPVASTSIESLDLDSLDYIEWILLVEEAFRIELPDDAAMKFTTVGDIADFVRHARK